MKNDTGFMELIEECEAFIKYGQHISPNYVKLMLEKAFELGKKSEKK